MSTSNFRYCVLYIQGIGSDVVKNVFSKALAPDHGEAFYPCLEYYRRDKKAVVLRPMFPGYLFFYTDFDIREIHEFLRYRRYDLNIGLRELALSNHRTADANISWNEGDESESLWELSDVDQEEAQFLDYLREGGGLLAMSSGYEVVVPDWKKSGGMKKSYVVMEGPLKAYENQIVAVDKHNRRAFLSFAINGHHAQAGFSCLPRAHWFPKKDSNIVALSDGSEVDISELKSQISPLQHLP